MLSTMTTNTGAAADIVLFGVIATVILIILLIAKELASAAIPSAEENQAYNAALALKKLSYETTAFVIPLLFTFSLIIATKIIAIL